MVQAVAGPGLAAAGVDGLGGYVENELVMMVLLVFINK